MAPTYGPITKRNKNVNDGLYRHKVMPSYHVSKEVEFQPAVPCLKCFPGYKPHNFESECLGVQNVIIKSPSSKNASLSSSLSLLQQHFHSIQVHTGQMELLCRISSVKVFVAHYQSDWDLQILAHVLADKLGKYAAFLNVNPSSPNLKFPVPDGTKAQPGENRSIQVLFINFDNSESHLEEMYHQTLSNPALDISLIPVAISYEFTPGNPLNSKNNLITWKPRVRVNFGLPHFFREFTRQNTETGNLAMDLRKHFHHEIWKNTAIMSTHLVSMLLDYRLGPNPSKSDCARLITEFQTEFRSSFDFAFIGEIDNIADYSLKLLAANLDAAPLSLPADVLKHESIMIKSLFAVMNMTGVDYQFETCKISQKAVLEMFREMAKILRYDLEYVHPPCMNFSTIEEMTFDRLARHSVASLQSSETNSEEQQKALRIARHLDIDYEDEDDDDYWPLPTHSSQDVSLYVTISNAISRKWVAEIAESLINIYYVAARQLLELRKVDVMEESDFLGNVADAMNTSSIKKISGESLKNTVKNALKMFADEGIIGSHQHSTVTVIYVKNPLDIDNLCSLIHSIAQFV